MCPLGRNASATTQLAQQSSTLMTNCRPNDGRTEKYRKKVDLHFMHDSPTWHQRVGVKTFSHTPTLLASHTCHEHIITVVNTCSLLFSFFSYLIPKTTSTRQLINMCSPPRVTYSPSRRSTAGTFGTRRSPTRIKLNLRRRCQRACR